MVRDAQGTSACGHANDGARHGEALRAAGISTHTAIMKDVVCKSHLPHAKQQPPLPLRKGLMQGNIERRAGI